MVVPVVGVVGVVAVGADEGRVVRVDVVALRLSVGLGRFTIGVIFSSAVGCLCETRANPGGCTWAYK